MYRGEIRWEIQVIGSIYNGGLIFARYLKGDEFILAIWYELNALLEEESLENYQKVT